MVPPRGTARLCAFCARCTVNVLGGVGLITSLGTYVEMGWGGVGLKTSFGTCTPTWCYVVRDGVGWGICLACYTCKNVLHATRAYVRCHGNNICCYACTCYVLGVWCSVDGLCRIPQRPKKKTDRTSASWHVRPGQRKCLAALKVKKGVIILQQIRFHRRLKHCEYFCHRW